MTSWSKNNRSILKPKTKMQKESNILKLLSVKLSQLRVSIFRNNVGTGWVGETFKIAKPTILILNGKPVQITTGDLIIKNPRPLRAGLHEGSSDLIGWKTVEITPEMIGKKVAIFVSIEGKTDFGRISNTQAIWLQNVKNAGGIGYVCRNMEAVEKCLNDYDKQLKA